MIGSIEFGGRAPSPQPSPTGRGKSEAEGEGNVRHRTTDILGRVYEYFLTRFASAEGKNGGQFYTPSCVVRCFVQMLGPYKGRIYDPCCGSGGMFVQSEKFVESHGGKLCDSDWFVAKSKGADAKRSFRDRRRQTLFIDARKLGTLIDRVHRELTDADLQKISSTYHLWRGDPFDEKMPRLMAELEAQFVKSSKLEEPIKANLKGLGYAL